MKINIFYKLDSSPRGILSNDTLVSQDSLAGERKRAISEQILAIFQENPELPEEEIAKFKSMVNRVIMPDPDRFRNLLDKLYANQQLHLSSLNGAAREESVRRFSDFISGLMTQYVHINQFNDLMNKTQQVSKALSESTRETINDTQTELADLKATFA